jgi:hypothetical protein
VEVGADLPREKDGDAMSEVMTWLGAGGGGVAVLKAVYDLVRTRADVRKTGAEAAQVLVHTAAESNKDLGEDLKEVRAEVRALGQAQRSHEVLLRTHHRWDEQVVDQLRLMGREISDPPPLYLEGT